MFNVLVAKELAATLMWRYFTENFTEERMSSDAAPT